MTSLKYQRLGEGAHGVAFFYKCNDHAFVVKELIKKDTYDEKYKEEMAIDNMFKDKALPGATYPTQEASDEFDKKCQIIKDLPIWRNIQKPITKVQCEKECLMGDLHKSVLDDIDIHTLVTNVFECVNELHTKNGYCHNDIKPSNIFIHGDTPLVGDFGEASPGTEMVGTPLFMGPVIIEGQLHNVHKALYREVGNIDKIYEDDFLAIVGNSDGTAVIVDPWDRQLFSIALTFYALTNFVSNPIKDTDKKQQLINAAKYCVSKMKTGDYNLKPDEALKYNKNAEMPLISKTVEKINAYGITPTSSVIAAKSGGQPTHFYRYYTGVLGVDIQYLNEPIIETTTDKVKNDLLNIMSRINTESGIEEEAGKISFTLLKQPLAAAAGVGGGIVGGNGALMDLILEACRLLNLLKSDAGSLNSAVAEELKEFGITGVNINMPEPLYQYQEASAYLSGGGKPARLAIALLSLLTAAIAFRP